MCALRVHVYVPRDKMRSGFNVTALYSCSLAFLLRVILFVRLFIHIQISVVLPLYDMRVFTHYLVFLNTDNTA
jgi:hypothetical protein